MPELPEVETARRGISPHVKNQRVIQVRVYQPKLRWSVPKEVHEIEGHVIKEVARRGKYLLLESKVGTIMIHLGMSGNVRICDKALSPEKHDHVDIELENALMLRLHDPRRFGSVLWAENSAVHPLIKNLGPEPLSSEFTALDLYTRSRSRKVNIKSYIMNSHIVVGVGNIYASESLFMAGINPKISAGRISLKRYEKLVFAIKTVLSLAIDQGGTTLKDFVNADGDTGYFQLKLSVYGRVDKPCPQCSKPVRQFTQSQRSTFYCPQCQK